jgi:hypothetical protein
MRELGKHHAPQEGLGGARRILVYGVTGSGRTTAAARTSETAGIRLDQRNRLDLGEVG